MEHMFDDGTFTPYVDDCVEAVLQSDIYIIILDYSNIWLIKKDNCNGY